MITGGEVSLRSLQCNKNPYNLDSSANWLHWKWNTDQTHFQAFAKSMIAVRRARTRLCPGQLLIERR